MGLQSEKYGAEHEGYLVGYDADGHEFAYPEESPVEVAELAAGCSCGWRSPRWPALPGATWTPYSVRVPTGEEEAVDELVHGLWVAHLQGLQGEEYERAGLS